MSLGKILSSGREQKIWDRSLVMVAALIIRTSLEGGILLYELNGHPEIPLIRFSGLRRSSCD